MFCSWNFFCIIQKCCSFTQTCERYLVEAKFKIHPKTSIATTTSTSVPGGDWTEPVQENVAQKRKSGEHDMDDRSKRQTLEPSANNIENGELLNDTEFALPIITSKNILFAQTMSPFNNKCYLNPCSFSAPIVEVEGIFPCPFPEQLIRCMSIGFAFMPSSWSRCHSNFMLLNCSAASIVMKSLSTTTW